MSDDSKKEGDRAAEEAVLAKARRTEAVPSASHAVFRSWCPLCSKGRPESYGQRKQQGGAKEAARVDHTRKHGEQ
jgi:hypothetical protein